MKPRILVIDNDISTRLLLENFLSRDYEIIAKSNGLEALAWLEEEMPDMIICDIQMPGMDGYEVLRSVRERGYTRQPVMILTGSEPGHDRVECYQPGAQDYLDKPFNPGELEEKIRKNLNPIHNAMKW